MSKQQIFKGSGVALVTPMKKDGSINYETLEDLIDFQLKNKTKALIICATTGEGSTLLVEERKEIIDFVIKKVKGEVPVIAGTGSDDTKFAVELSLDAKELGVDGLLLITPYYNKTSQKGIIEHYRYIADRVNLPIILYNNPTRTGLNITPQTYYELSKIPNIVGTKEANTDISQVVNVRRLCGDELFIYSGNEDLTIPILSLGGVGLISSLANICPKECNYMCEFFFEGNIDKAVSLLLKFYPLIKLIYKDVNPMPIKAALNLIGFDAGMCRLPLIDIEKQLEEEIYDLIKEYKISK